MTDMEHSTEKPSLCSTKCKICGGNGYVKLDLPLGDPNFGKLIHCPNMNPFAFYGPQSGLSAEDQHLSWDQFIEINGINTPIRTIRQVMSRGWGWVYIWGAYGLGKTKLLMTAVARSIASKKPSIYTTMALILNDVRSGYSDEYSIGEAEKRLKRYYSAQMLCIDEFDRIKLTSFADDTRFTLMDQRYISAIRKKSITIIASNISPEEYTGYLSDRIHDGRFEIIHLEGISARPNLSLNEGETSG